MRRDLLYRQIRKEILDNFRRFTHDYLMGVENCIREIINEVAEMGDSQYDEGKIRIGLADLGIKVEIALRRPVHTVSRGINKDSAGGFERALGTYGSQ